MRHGVKQRKLNRTASHRKSMLGNMAVALVKHEQIMTTLPKAKALRPFVERLITLARRDDLHARRLIISRLPEKKWAKKLFEEIGPRYMSRPGGYTRILKAGFRKGDNAPMAIIELLDRNTEAKGMDSGPVVQANQTAER